MKSLKLLPLFIVLGASLACSDDTEKAGDSGMTKADALADGASPDQFVKKLPAGYKPYKCTTPGKSCNAHDACAFNPICGSDFKCWPEYLMDCDDKLACTTDKCMGLGLCSNLPKAGWCRVMYRTGKDDGGVPITEPRCVKEGTRKPDDACYACAPTKYDAGAKDNTKWMPVSGGTCDDKNSCTKNDTCLNGTCKGTSFSSLCSDGYGCTTDKCDGKGGCLGNELKTGWCLINGSCYKKGGKKLDGTCNECDPLKSVSDWTPISDTCTIDSKCYNHGDKHASKCAECDTKVSTSHWTVKGTTAGCYINKLCKKVGQLDTIKCAKCDPTKNKYKWTPLAGVCKINNKCYNKGAKHPLGCAECDPSVSATSWTVKGSYCLINNKCYNPKAKDSINCSTCDPVTSKYKWTAIPGLCKISGTCYSSGASHPGKCAVCDPTTSATSWTVKSATNQCLINNVCKKPGDKDLSGCATCVPSKSKYAWTGTSGLCKIDGKCYSSGTTHPKLCGVCAPASSVTSWTPTTGKCVINQLCYSSGATDSTSCGKCAPGTSGTTWTVSSGKSCIVGPNKCVSTGAKEKGGCGTCNPLKDTNGWTKGTGCYKVHQWSKKFGGSSSDYGWSVATDANGNVFVTGYFYNSMSIGGTTLTSNGSADIYVASFSPSGQFRWAKAFGGSSYDYGYGIAVDGAGNVYVTGTFRGSANFGGGTISTSGTYNDIFVASFDNSGKHRWSKGFGASSYDYGYGIGTDSSGNVYVTGYMSGSVSFGGTTLTSNGSYDIFLASFTSTGTHRWSKNFGSTSSDYGYDLTVDGGGNVTITGYFYNSADFGGGTLTSKGSGDIYLASFTPAGKHRWSKNFGSTSYDYGWSVASDKAGNVYASGYFYNSVDFGGGTITSNGGADPYVISYTNAGVHRWSKGFGSTSYDYGYGIGVDNMGNVYATGYFYNTMKVAGTTLTSNGSGDMYLASWDATGNDRFARGHGGTSSDYGYDVAGDNAGNVFVTGYFYNSADFGGGNLTATSTDAYLVKLK